MAARRRAFKGKWKVKGRAVIASLLFALLNCALANPFANAGSTKSAAARAGDQIQRSLADAASAYIGQAYWTTKGAPVALIGSSLMIAPLWASDVKRGHFVKGFDAHHQSLHMQNSLWQRNISKDVFSFATPGQFVSDTYLIVDKYLKGKHKPSILIYGLAPRDFCDSTTDGIRTTIFDQLATIDDMSRVNGLYLSSFEEQVDFVLNRSIFLYHKRNRYQAKVEEAADNAWTRMLGPGKICKTRELGGDGQFLMGNDRGKIWDKSVAEYKQRYKKFDQSQFDKQKACFDALLKLCKERDIKLYVIAMPLTRDNRALLPLEHKKAFDSTVRELTARYDVPFIDFDKNGGYLDDHFYDTVHLSMLGGDRLIEQLSDIVQTKESGLVYSDEMLQGKKMLAMPGEAQPL